MTNANYRRGADFEREVRRRLQVQGCMCWRVAGSKGEGGVDLVACNRWGWLLVQCKINGGISANEKQILVNAAKLHRAKAVLAFKSEGKLKFSVLFAPSSEALDEHALDFGVVAFDNFVAEMRSRLIKGKEKYRGAWRQRDLMRDIREELLDIANYAFLEACKIGAMKDGGRKRRSE